MEIIINNRKINYEIEGEGKPLILLHGWLASLETMKPLQKHLAQNFKEYNVDIRLYTIIYKLVEEMEQAITGMLDPEFVEKNLGTVEIRKIFKFSKIGNIAGCYVTDGIVKNNANVRVIRDGVVLCEDKISSLQKGKDNVKEMKKGYECGLTLESFNDIKEGDILEVYEMQEVRNG